MLFTLYNPLSVSDMILARLLGVISLLTLVAPVLTNISKPRSLDISHKHDNNYAILSV